MNYYINCITDATSLQRKVKELIPDMNLRRRMSTLVKNAVCTGVEALIEFEMQNGGAIDAVITATGLGCIADSEKFLANLIESKEEMLNPTPFIQSTFNTVGAQIALIRSLHVYNNTFTHRYTGFESALIDAMLRLNLDKAEAVLVGVFDEATPTLEKLMQRMGLLKDKQLGEGSYFFVLTKKQLPTSVAVISLDAMPTVSVYPSSSEGNPLRESENGISNNNLASTVSVSAENNMLWCGAVAQTMLQAILMQRSCSIVNDLGGKFNSFISVQCL